MIEANIAVPHQTKNEIKTLPIVHTYSTTNHHQKMSYVYLNTDIVISYLTILVYHLS